MKSIIQSISQNRFFGILFLPVSLYYTIVSMYYCHDEHISLKRAIQSNESFFKALATLGFQGHRLLPSVFYTILEVDEKLTEVEIHQIAQKQIVQVVVKYLRNELLLDKLSVSTEIQDQNVLFEIRPATLDIALRNATDTIVSIVLYALAFFIYLAC